MPFIKIFFYILQSEKDKQGSWNKFFKFPLAITQNPYMLFQIPYIWKRITACDTMDTGTIRHRRFTQVTDSRFTNLVSKKSVTQKYRRGIGKNIVNQLRRNG